MVGNKGIKKVAVLSMFLLPSLIGMCIFLIIPIISSLGLSFTEWDLLGEIKWVGIDNYVKIFHDETFHEAFRHTLIFILGYLPSVLIISLCLAMLLNSKIKGLTLFRGIYFLPVISSWVAISVIWKWILNPEYGLMNYFLSLIGITGPAWLSDPKWAMVAVIITSVWKDVAFVTVIYLAGLQDIPDMYYEAANIDGASGFRKFINITIPLLSNTTFFVLIISLINSFQVFDQIWVMTEGGPAGATSVLVEQIYKNAFKYYKMGYASALSWVLFGVIFLVTILQNTLKNRYGD